MKETLFEKTSLKKDFLGGGMGKETFMSSPISSPSTTYNRDPASAAPPTPRGRRPDCFTTK